jgi:hypothetical protein
MMAPVEMDRVVDFALVLGELVGKLVAKLVAMLVARLVLTDFVEDFDEATLPLHTGFTVTTAGTALTMHVSGFNFAQASTVQPSQVATSKGDSERNTVDKHDDPVHVQ